MHYIISLKHTHRHDPFIVFWAPNNAGYAIALQNAGEYEEPEEGYHDSDSAKPILIEDAKKLSQTLKLPYESEEKTRVPNTKEVWQVLGVKMTKNGLARK